MNQTCQEKEKKSFRLRNQTFLSTIYPATSNVSLHTHFPVLQCQGASGKAVRQQRHTTPKKERGGQIIGQGMTTTKEAGTGVGWGGGGTGIGSLGREGPTSPLLVLGAFIRWLAGEKGPGVPRTTQGPRGGGTRGRGKRATCPSANTHTWQHIQQKKRVRKKKMLGVVRGVCRDVATALRGERGTTS